MPVLAAMVVPGLLSAQLVQLRLVTSAYAWQQQDTVDETSQHLFGYQTAQLSVAGEHLSLHTYFQGFNDFAGPVKNQGRIRVYNLYAKYSGLLNVLDIGLGRQAVFGGVGNGTIDGGSATLRLFDSRLKLLGYYGSHPPSYYKLSMIDNVGDNSMLGGRLTATPVSFGTVSVSYVRKTMKPESYLAVRRDTLFNPYSSEIRPYAVAEEYVGGDVSVEYGDRVSAYGRYDYDLNQEQTDRIQVFTRVKVAEPFALTGEYIYREPRLSYNSIFWVFTSTTVTELDGGFEVALPKNWQFFAKYGYVSYGGDDRSDRATLGLNGRLLSMSASFGTGFGGELKNLAFTAGYPLLENTLTPTVSASLAQYKLSADAHEEEALSIAGGAVYRPMPLLAVDAQLQWISNKIYASDLRLFVRFSYLLTQRLNIF